MGVKGVQARPKVVICISNTLDIKPTTLNSLEAINRRRNFTVAIEFKNTQTSRLEKRDDFSHLRMRYGIGAKSETSKMTEVQNLEQLLEALDKSYLAFLESKKKLVALVKQKRYVRKFNKEYFLEHNAQSGMVFYEVLVLSVSNALFLLAHAQSEMITFGANWFCMQQCFRFFGYNMYNEDGKFFAWKKSPWKSAFNLAFLSVSALTTAYYTGNAIAFMIMSFYGAGAESGEQGVGKTKPVRRVTASAQSGVSMDAISDNVVKLHHSGRINNAVFVNSNILLFNRHFLFPKQGYSEYIPNGTEFRIQSSSMAGVQTFLFDIANVHFITRKREDKLEQTDMILYQCPKHIHKRKDIEHRFTNGEYNFLNRDVTLIKYDGTRVHFMSGRVTEDHISVDQLMDGDVIRRQELHNLVSYNIPTSPGDCGSLLLVDDPSIQDPLVGIHVIGKSVHSDAAGTILAQAELKLALAELKMRFRTRWYVSQHNTIPISQCVTRRPNQD